MFFWFFLMLLSFVFAIYFIYQWISKHLIKALLREETWREQIDKDLIGMCISFMVALISCLLLYC
jgi:hypothetical protein